jgi:metal-responsive CopG/Arc/MetJ family transcriptional regulator
MSEFTKKNRRVSIRTPRALAAEIDAYAKKAGKTRNQVISQLLCRAMGRGGDNVIEFPTAPQQ